MPTFTREYRFFLPALLAFLAELAMLTFWRNRFGHHASAIVFFSASLLCGITGVWLSCWQRDHLKLTKTPVQQKRAHNRTRLVFLLLLAALSLFAFWQLHRLFQQNPVSLEQSDVIPQTRVLVQRLLQDQFPYQLISFGAYELFPTYLPLQWLPFTMAEMMGTDYRLLALLILLLVIAGFAAFVYKREVNTARLFFLAPLAFLPLMVTALCEPSIFARTLETLITAYYFLLCVVLFSRSAVMLSAALVLCLLSRYSVLLWVPLCLFMLYLAGEKKRAATVFAICTLSVLLIYVIPFLRQDNSIFMKGYHYHSQAALAEWQGQSWQPPEEKPFQLFRGIGLAGSFFDFYKGSTVEKLKAFQKLHFALSAATIVVLGIFFYRKRRQVSLPVYALASLKIYLAVFYHFIQIPYDYLFLTLVYVSVPILWVAATPGNRIADPGRRFNTLRKA